MKPLSIEDVPSYERHFVDYEVIRHLSAVVPWPYPANGVRDFFENVLLPSQGVSRWSWGLCLREHPTEVIGCIELWRPGTPENRGFWLARKHWGRGLMGEAVRPVNQAATSLPTFSQFGIGSSQSRMLSIQTPHLTDKALRPLHLLGKARRFGLFSGAYENIANHSRLRWASGQRNAVP